jgi:hypothetical protein
MITAPAWLNRRLATILLAVKDCLTAANVVPSDLESRGVDEGVHAYIWFVAGEISARLLRGTLDERVAGGPSNSGHRA